jgi:hypothetical protein
MAEVSANNDVAIVTHEDFYGNLRNVGAVFTAHCI